MKAYRISTKLKIGLIAFASLIAVASLAYTNHLVDRLKDREQSVVRLWASALEQLPKAQQQSLNPYQQELAALEAFVRSLDGSVGNVGLDTATASEYIDAIRWAQGMPPASELSFIMDDILVPNAFDIPAIVTDSRTSEALSWRNIDAPASLRGIDSDDSLRYVERLNALVDKMDRTYAAVPIEITFPGLTGVRLEQQVHYGESPLVSELRWYPYVQFAFVGLFILVGYLGFSYVRRSEQSSLWVGMAKEAAHQLGTPISSLMGWLEILRADHLDLSRRLEAVEEIDKDVERLTRVASRFSDIGSMPRLSVESLESVVNSTVDYIRRRLPSRGPKVILEAKVDPSLRAPVNVELFEWVIENLLKNSLDAIEGGSGSISLRASRDGDRIQIDVSDTGKGIDRREWKNVFRPGYSTKKRGWGLGLSLAKRIVEDYHGGTLTLVQSRPGHGATFRIEIPA
ncbi:MAG: HAMP domain-containing histidine kinase, partial [Rhodothermia bacterium]|nr:HAMP domain-containing histidine kinase [Rhodothermia bacterium]